MFSVKSQKTWTILSVIVSALLALAEVLTITVIAKVDILPTKYILVLVALAVVFTAGIVLSFFVQRKGKISLTRRIVACLLAVAAVGVCAVVSHVFYTTYETIQDVTMNNADMGNDVLSTIPTKENMYILIRADDPNTSLAAMANYTYGVNEKYEEKKVAKFVEWIGEKTGVVPQPVGYVTPEELADALLNKQVDAIIISGVIIALLEDVPGYEQFMTKVKIMAEVPYADLKDQNASQQGGNNTNNSGGATGPSDSAGSNNSGMLTDPEDATNPEVDPTPQEKNVTNTPFAVYIGGSDEYSSRNDVNILMVVNPNTKQILLINTPRDAYVINPHSDDGAMDKLTHCGLYGSDCSREALSILYGTDVAFFGQINFKGFKELINAIGGITVYSDYAFTAINTKIQKGENQLNGQQALNFARERSNVVGGDNGRGKNQMKVIAAIVKKLTSSTALITNYASIMASLKGMFKTSMQAEQINMLVKMQLNDMATWDINTFSVTGRAGSEITYSWPGHKLYVMHLNQNYVDHASNLINQVVNGAFLKPEDMKVPS